jgi:hypothetical protein
LFMAGSEWVRKMAGERACRGVRRHSVNAAAEGKVRLYEKSLLDALLSLVQAPWKVAQIPT